MHEHDLDLIMALAEGTLDASDVPSAEAEIAACAECSQDLELQRLALGALEATPPVAMTEVESSQMRRTLRRELGLVTATPAPAKARRRWFPIGALASAAALLLALVVIGPGLDLVGPGSDDSGSGDAVAFSATTTTAAAGADEGADGGAPTVAGADTQREELSGELEEANAIGGTTTTHGATTTTSAAAETTTAPATPDAPATAMRFAAEPDLTTLRDAIVSLGITADTDLSQFEAELRALGLDFELTTNGPAAYTQECLNLGVDAIESATSGYELGQAPVGDSEEMVAVYETGTPGNIVVAAQDTTTCEVLDTSS